jgi:hypothetical protein
MNLVEKDSFFVQLKELFSASDKIVVFDSFEYYTSFFILRFEKTFDLISFNLNLSYRGFTQ